MSYLLCRRFGIQVYNLSCGPSFVDGCQPYIHSISFYSTHACNTRSRPSSTFVAGSTIVLALQRFGAEGALVSTARRSCHRRHLALVNSIVSRTGLSAGLDTNYATAGYAYYCCKSNAERGVLQNQGRGVCVICVRTCPGPEALRPIGRQTRTLDRRNKCCVRMTTPALAHTVEKCLRMHTILM